MYIYTDVTQQYIPVLQVLVKYVYSTYLYRRYSRSTSHSSSGNTRIVISVSFTYPFLLATHYNVSLQDTTFTCDWK